MKMPLQIDALRKLFYLSLIGVTGKTQRKLKRQLDSKKDMLYPRNGTERARLWICKQALATRLTCSKQWIYKCFMHSQYWSQTHCWNFFTHSQLEAESSLVLLLLEAMSCRRLQGREARGRTGTETCYFLAFRLD